LRYDAELSRDIYIIFSVFERRLLLQAAIFFVSPFSCCRYVSVAGDTDSHCSIADAFASFLRADSTAAAILLRASASSHFYRRFIFFSRFSMQASFFIRQIFIAAAFAVSFCRH